MGHPGLLLNYLSENSSADIPAQNQANILNIFGKYVSENKWKKKVMCVLYNLGQALFSPK